MSTQGNGGIYSKFQERLRKIRLSRIKKKKQNDEFIQDRVQDIRKSIKRGYVPRHRTAVSSNIVEKSSLKDDSVSKVIVNIRATAKDRDYVRNKVGIDDVHETVKEEEFTSIKKDFISVNEGKKENNTDKQLEEKTNFEVKENNDSTKKKRVSYISGAKKNRAKGISDTEKEQLLEDLGVEIINKLKESFEDKLDQLDVLESELYILKQKQDDELELNKVKEIKKRINELVAKINDIIEQYNLYKKNYYIDNVIDIDDNVIVDDIINYRELLNSFDSEKKFVKEYKALEEFKRLYINLKEVRDNTEKLVSSNEEKIEKYEIRDKKYDGIKLGMVSAIDIDKKCMLEIERQNKYFKELMSKINIIDREEYITSHMRGIGELISSSLKYMGLMVLSPLSGLIPGITMHTLATKKMISNIYQNLHIEEVKHVHYQAINYDSELNHHLDNIGYTEVLIDDTLNQVERLKEDFMMIYNSKIPGYDDTLKKIQKIQAKLIHNQNKVSIIKNNLKKSKKINEDKLKKVKKLNEQKIA